MKLLWDLFLGFVIGGSIALMLFIVLMAGLRGCVSIANAQTVDVRIIEDDHTISGIRWPGESDPMAESHRLDMEAAIDNAVIDIEYALRLIEIMTEEPPKYPSHAACERDNAGIAKVTRDLSEHNWEARAKRLQNDCTEFLP